MVDGDAHSRPPLQTFCRQELFWMPEAEGRSGLVRQCQSVTVGLGNGNAADGVGFFGKRGEAQPNEEKQKQMSHDVSGVLWGRDIVG